VYNPRRPWLPFHRHVECLKWDPSICELVSPCEYFKWNQPSEPSHGGSWGLRRLEKLFSKRDTAETNLRRLIEDAVQYPEQIQFINPSVCNAIYDFPWFDPLEWEDACGWTTWVEGRDHISYTTLYVAEVQAINEWLTAQLETVRSVRRTVFPLKYIGAWTPTLNRKEDWEFLMSRRIPLYIITRIPAEHRLLRDCVEGNLDGDERYRTNIFDSEHSLENFWIMPLVSPPYPNVGCLNLQCRPEYLPSLLYPVTPSSQGLTSTSCYGGWTSSIYLDTRAPRLGRDLYLKQKHQQDSRLELLETFALRPGTVKLLRVETDRHPLLDVIGGRHGRDNKTETWEEIYDENAEAYYPRKLGRSRAKERKNNAIYLWSYPAVNIVIVSDFKFPGRDPSFGRTDNAEEEEEEEELYSPRNEEPRTYWDIDQFGRLREALFVWTPFVDPDAPDVSHEPPKSVACRSSNTTEPMLLDGPSSSLALTYEDDQQFMISDDPIANIWKQIHPSPPSRIIPTKPYGDYVKEFVSFETRRDAGVYAGLFDANCTYSVEREQELSILTNEPMTDACKLDRIAEMRSLFQDLESQREIMRKQMGRRIFKRAKGDAVVSQYPVAWHLPEGSAEHICYPVRMSGIHADVSLDDLFSMLSEVMDIFPTDVVLLSSYFELDGMSSIELALRYCEDSLGLVTVLNGVKSDDRYIEVQFLHAMVGCVNALPYPLDPQKLPRGCRNLLTRLKRTVTLTRYPCSPPEVSNVAFALESQLA
jgi:hypothetical protein